MAIDKKDPIVRLDGELLVRMDLCGIHILVMLSDGFLVYDMRKPYVRMADVLDWYDQESAFRTLTEVETGMRRELRRIWGEHEDSLRKEAAR